MEQLFFQLIQISIGTLETLSRVPTEREWGELYNLAKKQSLIGVCFAGVQRLCNSESGDYCGMNELQYLTWMGLAAKIQQRNQVVNEQCAELQTTLSANGLQASVLKGQGIAQLYGERLQELRQSGDIDMLVDCEYKRAAEFVTSITGKEPSWAYKDINLPIFEETEVELHIKPGLMFNPFHNHVWQEWYKSNKNIVFLSCLEDGYSTPSIDFNLVYILHHCYMHLFESGMGLRQIMDYYFVLRIDLYANKEKCLRAIESLGMMRFLKGIMYVMVEVFGMEEKYLLTSPDPKEGKFLLNEIMQSGNFGKHDDRFQQKVDNRRDKLKYFIKRSRVLCGHYPQEALWMPWYFIWHYVMKTIKNMNLK